MVDIDHFKRVNDTYGHAAGDDVLRELAARAMDSVRSVDLVARLGGEEFVVVMPETGLAIAAAVAERLRLAVASEPFDIWVSAASGWRVTVSIGVTTALARERRSRPAAQACRRCSLRGQIRRDAIGSWPARRNPSAALAGSPPPSREQISL